MKYGILILFLLLLVDYFFWADQHQRNQFEQRAASLQAHYQAVTDSLVVAQTVISIYRYSAERGRLPDFINDVVNRRGLDAPFSYENSGGTTRDSVPLPVAYAGQSFRLYAAHDVPGRMILYYQHDDQSSDIIRVPAESAGELQRRYRRMLRHEAQQTGIGSSFH